MQLHRHISTTRLILAFLGQTEPQRHYSASFKIAHLHLKVMQIQRQDHHILSFVIFSSYIKVTAFNILATENRARTHKATMNDALLMKSTTALFYNDLPLKTRSRSTFCQLIDSFFCEHNFFFNFIAYYVFAYIYLSSAALNKSRTNYFFDYICIFFVLLLCVACYWNRWLIWN